MSGKSESCSHEYTYRLPNSRSNASVPIVSSTALYSTITIAMAHSNAYALPFA
ncbi:hypothetical protein D3C73_1673690 [compost metagenome]